MVDKMYELCQAFFYDHFWDSIFEEFRDNWVEDSETNPNSCNFGNWFMDKVEEHLNLHVKTLCADDNNDIWLMVPEMDMGHGYRLYKKRYNLKTADPTDAQLISCLLMEHIMEQGLLQNWMDELEGGLTIGSLAESEEETSDTESEEDSEAWFDRKYPNATCHRCKEKLNGATVVYCGDGCETWYCADCHEDGTDDCPVCAEPDNE